MYWYKQTDKPLFPELDWDKPERRDQAGRLLIIGGNLHNLTAPATAYNIVRETGIGEVQFALPDKTKSLVGRTLPGAIFLPSTSSGELGQEASTHLLELCYWADSLLLPGDSGRNSQTTIVLETILQNCHQTAVITRDAVDSLTQADFLLKRSNITLVVSFAQLQKLVQQASSASAITFDMDLVAFVNFMHQWSQTITANIVTLHQNQFVVASNGNVSTTKSTFTEDTHWRTKAASLTACYQTWSPTKPFEALTEAVYQLLQV